MAAVRCPYCHEMVEERAFPAHEAAHRKAKPDGQQTDYVTLPPDQRAGGDLATAPRVYVHKKCGVGTRMPEEIVRSYLVNPYLYNADETFCCGCNRHVPFRECVWTETGEDLQSYTDKLRAMKPEMKPKGCLGMGVVLLALLGAAAARFVA
ncbi:MAG: hypothetical protein K2W96_24180 [Gemmataceae bacterium]|nr:hypothetical protein [Gemmataceae bacterium]